MRRRGAQGEAWQARFQAQLKYKFQFGHLRSPPPAPMRHLCNRNWGGKNKTVNPLGVWERPSAKSA